MKSTNVKFLVIGDLHGEMPIIHTSKFDAILCPGDICGDDIRPYWLKVFRKRKEGIEVDLDSVCPKWKQKLLEIKSIQKGKKVLKYLNSLNKPIFLVPGNWEPTQYEDGIKISEKNKWKNIILKYKNIKDVEYKKINFKGINIIGHGSTSGPEQLIKNKNNIQAFKYYQKVQTKLNNLFSKNNKPTIFISHNVPYNTKLDLIDYPASNMHGKHFGSTLARKMIIKHKPMLCIGGHIHEGFGKDILKKTICINAGFGGNVNTLIEVDISNNEIINIKFLGKNKIN